MTEDTCETAEWYGVSFFVSEWYGVSFFVSFFVSEWYGVSYGLQNLALHTVSRLQCASCDNARNGPFPTLPPRLLPKLVLLALSAYHVLNPIFSIWSHQRKSKIITENMSLQHMHRVTPPALHRPLWLLWGCPTDGPRWLSQTPDVFSGGSNKDAESIKPLQWFPSSAVALCDQVKAPAAF